MQCTDYPVLKLITCDTRDISFIHSRVSDAGGLESLSDEQARKAIDSCAQMLISRYDEERGGFGSSPKFPRPSELNLLLVKHIRAKAAGNKAEAGLLSLPTAGVILQHDHVTSLQHSNLNAVIIAYC